MLIDEIGSPAVNDPTLHLRLFTEGRGGNWLLRQQDGTAWHIDANGVRHWVGTVQAQQDLSRTMLTFHPAQWAHDVCLYPRQERRTCASADLGKRRSARRRAAAIVSGARRRGCSSGCSWPRSPSFVAVRGRISPLVTRLMELW